MAPSTRSTSARTSQRGSAGGAGGDCTALENFWRSLSNLTIDFPAPGSGAPCQRAAEFWATSQASPVRGVAFNGPTSLDDYCSRPGYSSGGFIADSAFSGRQVLDGTQQQFLVRNSSLDGWSNGVWNQVFAGDPGPRPRTSVGGSVHHPGRQPGHRRGAVPADDGRPELQRVRPGGAPPLGGAVLGRRPEAGRAIALRRFFLAGPGDPAAVINAALARGQDLILTPGVYRLSQALEVSRPGTVVLGLGFPTLVPVRGSIAMRVAGGRGYGWRECSSMPGRSVPRSCCR